MDFAEDKRLLQGQLALVLSCRLKAIG